MTTGAAEQPVTTPASSNRGPARGPLPALDSRYLVALLITLVLVVAQLRYHITGGYARLVVALGVCVAVELGLSWFVRGKLTSPLSAYISGLSLTLLLKPQAGALWPFALAAFLAIASKYVLQYRGRHLWNPTNFAISLLLLTTPNHISVLSHQWGNDLATNLVIWAFGLLIVSRVKVLHITLSYVAAFLLFAAIRAALLGLPLGPEIAPLTGPMYQLFVFFMVTDPKTIVRDRRWQVAVVVLIALAEAIIRMASDLALPLPIGFSAAPPLLALFIVGPVARWIDLRREARAPAMGGAAPA